MDIAQPTSLSVYRGQSRSGQGEGPGKTVLHGEQYIRVDGELYKTELLDEIRPWLTLDSDPADHQRLNDQLEGWSLFQTADYLFVVRLASAGTYDQHRAAYFAHGRAWKRNALPRGFDPGLYLGRSDAFDTPWRDDYPIHERVQPWPMLVGAEQIGAESETAARILGNLLQALTEGYPLIVAAPLTDFKSGSALHALINLSRGGLPGRLRARCSIRIYSRTVPEVFLRQLGASLVVVPENSASVALTAKPNATLLDRQGQRLAGNELAAPALEYAAALVERAVAIPEGLPYFSERVSDLSAVGVRRAIQIAYNVAYAMAGTADRRTELLRRYLPRAAEKLGPGLNWNGLLTADEWNGFPREAVLDQLLIDSRELSAGRREFLRVMEDGAAERGMRVDECLHDWWSPEDPGKVQRLIELLAHDPPLVSAKAAADCTAQIPLARLAQAGPLTRVLEAEAKSGLLSQRAEESSELALASRDPAIFSLLSRGVSEGRLEAQWARTFVRTESEDRVIEAAAAWLQDAGVFQREWGTVGNALLDQLRKLSNVPARLRPLILSAGRRVSPTENPETHLRLADVVARIDPPHVNNTLLEALWRALPDLPDARKSYLESIALDPEWRCLQLSRLPLSGLLQLASILQREESLNRFYAELDARMEHDPEVVADSLARSGWWFFWRRQSKVRDTSVLERSSFAWMASRAWVDGKEATLEAWDRALEDLPKTLGGADYHRLRNGWPWIPPFQEDQLSALLNRAEDLGGVAELAEAVPSGWTPRNGQPAHEHLLTLSRWSQQLPANALAWLLPDRGRAPSLSLEQSTFLYQHAGHRRATALEARIESVMNQLDVDAEQALKAAAEPDLWNNPRFATKLALWLSRRDADAVFWSVAERINDRIQAEPTERPQLRSQEVVQRLMGRRLQSTAQLLHAELPRKILTGTRIDRVIQALLEQRIADGCWQELAGEIDRAQSNGEINADDHPLLCLAQRIQQLELPHGEKRKLAEEGWRTLERAARDNRSLFVSLIISPLSREKTMLPLLSVAANMLGPGTLGRAALKLAFSTNSSFRQEVTWWRSLLQAIHGYRRYGELSSADDHPTTAIALIFDHLDSLREQEALHQALRLEAQSNPDWPAALEFGEITP